MQWWIRRPGRWSMRRLGRSAATNFHQAVRVTQRPKYVATMPAFAGGRLTAIGFFVYPPKYAQRSGSEISSVGIADPNSSCKGPKGFALDAGVSSSAYRIVCQVGGHDDAEDGDGCRRGDGRRGRVADREAEVSQDAG